VRRLQQRVGKLQSHFNQASDDVSQILVSAEKIAVRGGRITELEFDDEPAKTAEIIAAPLSRALAAGE
jgi:DNA recombination protein RmuC